MATADAQRYLQERGLPITQANLNRVGQLMAANQIAESGENTQDARMQAADTVSRLLGEFEQRSSGTRRGRATQPSVSVPGTNTDSTMPRSMGAPAEGSSPSPRDAAGTPPAQTAQTSTPADYDMDLASGVAAAILAGAAARFLGPGGAPAAGTTPAPVSPAPAPPGNPVTYTPPQARAPAPASAMGQTYTPPQGNVGPSMPASNSIMRAEGMPNLRAPAGGGEQVNPVIQQLMARDVSNTPARGAGGRMQPSPRGQVTRGTAPVGAAAGNVRPGVRGDMSSMIANNLAPIEMMGGGGPKLLMGLPRRQAEPVY